MSIASYAELLAATGRWMQRSDMAASFPDILVLAEVRLSRDLKLLALEKSFDFTTTQGASTYPLPADIVSVIRLERTIPGGRPEEIHSYAPEVMAMRTEPDQPRAYFYEAGVLNFPAPTVAGVALSLVYKSRVPALTEAAPTNTFLSAWPDVYLFAVLAEASALTFDDERAPVWDRRYRTAITEVNKTNNYRRQARLVTESAALLRRCY